MPRDNEHKIYKGKWACFQCRKCFKQANTLEMFFRPPHGEKRIVRCPQCRKPMTNMGWDFKVPKQTDVEQWKKVEVLAQHGYNFQSWCFWGEPHKGPGPRPARLRDVEAFLERQRQQSGEKE